MKKVENYMDELVLVNGHQINMRTAKPLLDYFVQMQSTRTMSSKKIIRLFKEAFEQNELVALKLLFYARDISEGLGERRHFRILIEYLSRTNPTVIVKNMKWIPSFGRWDDLYAFSGTPLERNAFALMKKQFEEDLISEQPSNLAKWLKSESASSYQSKKLALKTAQYFGISKSDYRKKVAALRKKLDVVEVKMTTNNWETINFKTVPMQANLKYRFTFEKKEPERYRRYVESIRQTKINMVDKTVHPLVNVVTRIKPFVKNQQEKDSLQTEWEAWLATYCLKGNALVVVDHSYSMLKSEMEMALTFGMFIAEKNKGAYHQHLLTFSENPQLVHLKGKTIWDKVHNFRKTDLQLTTNIQKLFGNVLTHAIKYQVSKEEMIDTIYIMTDMPIDCVENLHGVTGDCEKKPIKEWLTTFENEYQAEGYSLPKLVFWNLNHSNNGLPMYVDERGFITINGNDSDTYEAALQGVFLNPLEQLEKIASATRYEKITI